MALREEGGIKASVSSRTGPSTPRSDLEENKLRSSEQCHCSTYIPFKRLRKMGETGRKQDLLSCIGTQTCSHCKSF